MITARLAALALLLLPITATAQQRQQSAPQDCNATMGALPASVSGQASVIDGDTIAIIGLKPHVRLWGVQAPELRDKKTGQETLPGIRSRAALADLLGRNDFRTTCEPTKYDRYCRLVAICMSYLGENFTEDLGSALIDAGFAYGAWLDDAAPGQPRLGRDYARLEAAARAGRRGLWKEWQP